MSKFEVRLGVPGLGPVTEVYDFDNPGDCEALDTNVANGCVIYNMKEVPMNELIQTHEVEQTIRVSDEEFERLLATRPVAPEFDADGNLVGYVTTDDGDEPEATTEPTKH